MKGVYIRCTCPYVPHPDELIQWVGPSFYACHSRHIDETKGHVVEIASQTTPRLTSFPWPVEIYDITCMEFFAESMMETDSGICINNARSIPHERHPYSWRKQIAPICHYTNSVELYHPQSLQTYQFL